MTGAVPTPTPWRGFLLNLSLMVLLVVSALFTGLALSDQRAIEAGLETRGRALFNSIVLTRAWNAEHGGVFVEKRPGMVSNPYLDRPDRVGADGTVYTMKNPALMTREISEIAERQGAFRFHLTSLKPLNPDNAPDPFERDALERFERGLREATLREQRGGEPWFRYMAPLRVEASCLACHARQGYRLGDVRGGISVSFSMAEAQASIGRTRWSVAALFGVTSALLLLIIWRLVRRLRTRLIAAETRIRTLAITDDLTGIANRRHVGERLREEQARAARYARPFSVALLDLDGFKAINDTLGHDAGDVALVAVVRAVEAVLRDSDILGRWGGDEFLVVMPESDAAGARVVAERLRAAVEALRVEHRGATLALTLSAGLATWTPAAAGKGPDVQGMMKRADEALYRGKQNGRNRVES
jgi:diguanylate cyclase (GGDEF)-like protein